MANDSASKAYVLNLGEALHVEMRQAGVHVTVLVPVLVNTPVVARIGIDKIGLSAEAISAEQAVDEALTALAESRATHSRAGGHVRGVRGHEGRRGRDDQGAARGVPAGALRRPCPPLAQLLRQAR